MLHLWASEAEEEVRSGSLSFFFFFPKMWEQDGGDGSGAGHSNLLVWEGRRGGGRKERERICVKPNGV